MIEIEKVDKDYWECGSCGKNNRESEIRSISIGEMRRVQSVRLCSDCLLELDKKIRESLTVVARDGCNG